MQEQGGSSSLAKLIKDMEKEGEGKGRGPLVQGATASPRGHQCEGPGPRHRAPQGGPCGPPGHAPHFSPPDRGHLRDCSRHPGEGPPVGR